MEREIVLGDILTPQEHKLLGSSSKVLKYGDPVEEREWYIPEVIQYGNISIEEVNQARREKGHVNVMHISEALGLKGSICMRLSEANPETGETLRDPQVLGIWVPDLKNPDTGEIRKIEDRDPKALTEEVYRICKDRNNDLHHRIPNPEGKEGKPSLGEGNTGYRQ